MVSGIRVMSACVAVAMAGCSLTAAGGLGWPGGPTGACEAGQTDPPSFAIPIVDTVMAAVLVAGAAAINDVYFDPRGPLLITAGLATVSAGYGYSAVSKCRQQAREPARPVDCAAVKAKADELRARGGGTIRDQDFLLSRGVQQCFGS